MESPDFSLLSSLRGEFKSDDYIQPHYKESYRLAIDCLVNNGRESYQEFLKGERIGCFLSEGELLFITLNAEQLPPQTHAEEISDGPPDSQSSSGTYWPMHSDMDAPDLDLGWPEVMHDTLQTNIDLLFHPPRPNNPTIKEVVRKNIQEARQVIAIVMDMFTDVDIFKEVVDASIRGVPVYILLDDFSLKSFLMMAENQDVKIQQLRNMRVRTVKGQSYLCRSGAKFHGAMQQKFLLVDCHTTIYGSYSFTWSFEKINLSMVQVITGHLVKSYDEEFRTLYARSSVPAELCPLEGLFQHNGPHEQQMLPKFHSAQRIERRDQLRHTLDTVYRKTCEKKVGTRNFEERLFDEEPKGLGPLIENGIGVHKQMHQLQSTEVTNFLKRHSYAGERQDGYMPPNIRPRASNWNISRETGNVTNIYPMDNYLQVPLINRGPNILQSYNLTDKQVMSMQQNMPTTEKTSKSFMRTLRIESYLQNPDVPFRDSLDYLDQFEPLDKANAFMQARMRSSLVVKSTIPEQMEPDRFLNSSSGISSTAASNTPLHYSSMQWNPTAENRMSDEEFMLKRKSLQLLDDNWNNTSYGPGRNPYQSIYTSLGRTKSGHMITNPDILTDSWHKRHSVADPKSNNEYAHESSGHMYEAFARMQLNRSTAGINAQNGGYGPNLNEDQRSVSQYDANSITGTKSTSTHIAQEPPSRTVSAAALHANSTDLTNKSNHVGTQYFLKRSSKKIKSLLNAPEKKEDSVRIMETPSLKSSGSTDTLTPEDEEGISDGQRNVHQRATNSVKSSSQHHRSRSDDENLKYSKPRFRVEEHRNPLQSCLPKTTQQKKPTVLDRSASLGLDKGSCSKDRGDENRLYSGVEPLCSFEKKHSMSSVHSSREKSLPRGEAAIEHNLTRSARTHHENKLGRFFQRVGNLIHKNK
uniref:protein FAM83B n=1 Tax=Scatophagus argus TaxID=75038 RepID=UPI001ED84195|nr:protein FAM83B [Scatophagus argus]XP_046258460.1 protein FAM83B [Scatophagus argus]